MHNIWWPKDSLFEWELRRWNWRFNKGHMPIVNRNVPIYYVGRSDNKRHMPIIVTANCPFNTDVIISLGACVYQ